MLVGVFLLTLTLYHLHLDTIHLLARAQKSEDELLLPTLIFSAEPFRR